MQHFSWVTVCGLRRADWYTASSIHRFGGVADEIYIPLSSQATTVACGEAIVKT